MFPQGGLGRSTTSVRYDELRASLSTRILVGRSLCTLDKRLSRQLVCSTSFCTRELSGRVLQTLAQKRTCCGTHCTRRSCSTLLQPSSSLQVCYPAPTRRSAQISLSEPTVPCPSSRHSRRELPGREVAHSRVLPRFSTQSVSPPALSQPTQEKQVAPSFEWTTWPSRLLVESGRCVPRTSADLAATCNHTTVPAVFLKVAQSVLVSLKTRSASYPDDDDETCRKVLQHKTSPQTMQSLTCCSRMTLDA